LGKISLIKKQKGGDIIARRTKKSRSLAAKKGWRKRKKRYGKKGRKRK
jgi:hypothetical protein